MSPEREKRGHRVGFAALGGFVLGAATVLLVVWFYGAGHHAPSASAPAAPPVAPPPATSPAPQIPPAPPTAAPAPPQGATAPPAPPPGAPAPPPASPANPADAARGVWPADLQELARRQLLLPVAGVRRENLIDTYQDNRSGGRVHHALDIPAPRSTPVLAVEDGTVAKLFTSKLGGLTVYEFDPTSTYSYYYAHLDRYAEGLKEGDRLRKGQVVGYVGSTGDASAEAPHLHFEIVRLNPDKHWWQGTPIDPFLVFRPEAGGTALGR